MRQYVLKLFFYCLISIGLLLSPFSYSLYIVTPTQYFEDLYQEIKAEQELKKKLAYTEFLKDFLEEEQCIIRSNAKKQEIEICLEYADLEITDASAFTVYIRKEDKTIGGGSIDTNASGITILDILKGELRAAFFDLKKLIHEIALRKAHGRWWPIGKDELQMRKALYLAEEFMNKSRQEVLERNKAEGNVLSFQEEMLVYASQAKVMLMGFLFKEDFTERLKASFTNFGGELNLAKAFDEELFRAEQALFGGGVGAGGGGNASKNNKYIVAGGPVHTGIMAGVTIIASGVAYYGIRRNDRNQKLNRESNERQQELNREQKERHYRNNQLWERRKFEIEQREKIFNSKVKNEQTRIEREEAERQRKIEEYKRKKAELERRKRAAEQKRQREEAERMRKKAITRIMSRRLSGGHRGRGYSIEVPIGRGARSDSRDRGGPGSITSHHYRLKKERSKDE